MFDVPSSRQILRFNEVYEMNSPHPDKLFDFFIVSSLVFSCRMALLEYFLNYLLSVGVKFHAVAKLKRAYFFCLNVG